VSSVTVIVPTLNEALNIDILLEQVLTVRKDAGLDFDVLFVDSASVDGTGEKVLAWRDKAPVDLLQQGKRSGLASAVIDGARMSKSDIVLVMDADLSHPPGAIPLLLQPLLDGQYDMVIGSRYVSGGDTPEWPRSRRISSRLATVPAMLFTDVRDPLAGFFAVQRWRLADLPNDVPGFKIGLAVLAEYGRELRVKEVPIVFRDRNYGKSKMNGKVVFDYLRQVALLALRKATGKLAVYEADNR